MNPYTPYMYHIDPATGCYFPEHRRQHCPQPAQCPYHRPDLGPGDRQPCVPPATASASATPMRMSQMPPRRPVCAPPPSPYQPDVYDIIPLSVRPESYDVASHHQVEPRPMPSRSDLRRSGSDDMSRTSSCDTLGRMMDPRLRLSSGSLSTDDDEEARARAAALANRSTKGASKQRRDLINSEIGNLRDILPLPESSRQRLSQLQIMSLACCYVRKANYFARLFGENVPGVEQPFEFSQTLTGFLLILTREGKLLYISENITEHLGHSMVDMMTQGDSIYDIIDKRDHSMVQSQLSSGNQGNTDSEEKTFFCRMNVSRSFRRQAGFGDHKVMHVRGHYVQPMIRDHYGNQPVFMALCSPLVTPDVKDSMVQNDTMSFQTVHGLDMKFTEIAANGEHHLGYTDAEMYGRSWYEFIHPEDIKEAKEKHTQLFKSSRELGCMLTVRMLTSGGGFVWVNTVMYLRQPFLGDNTEPVIVCLNQVITDAEAPHFRLQSQLYSSHIARSPEFLSSPQGGSPSHPITQFAMEADNFNTGYQAPQQMLPTTVGTGYSEMGIPSASDATADLPGALPMQDLGQYSPRNPGSYSPPGDHKQILREGILNRLKRKQKEQASPGQCKPNKVPRMQEPNSGHGPQEGLGGGLMVTGTAFMAHNSFFGDSLGSLGGAVDVMGPIADVPVFAQLGIKEEIITKPLESLKVAAQNQSSLLEFSPPTPPTPAPSHSSSEGGDTQLTVDTTMCHSVMVPPSILTPESLAGFSPAHSTTQEDANHSSEQTVPNALVDLEDNVQFFSELDLLLPEADQKLLRPPPPYQLPQEPLSELDAVYLESFMAAVDTIEQKHLLNRALDIAMTASKEEKSPSAANSPMSSVPSLCESSPESQVSECEDIPDLELSDLTNEQMETLMATVGESLQGILPNQDLLGQFMLVPTTGAEGRDVVRPGDLLDGAQGLLQELNTLNQLAAQSPSHGDETISTAPVDSSL